MDIFNAASVFLNNEIFACFSFLFLGSLLHFSSLLLLFKIGKKHTSFPLSICLSVSLSVSVSLSLSLSPSLYISITSVSTPIYLSFPLSFSLFVSISLSLALPLCLPPPPPHTHTHTHKQTSCNLTWNLYPDTHRCTMLFNAQILGSPTAIQKLTFNFVMHTNHNGIFLE